MKRPTFDVFSGTPGEHPLWLETVEGLSNARERMEQLAAKEPGRYFAFSPLNNAALSRIETFREPEEFRPKTAET
jgi:hypothetical protein